MRFNQTKNFFKLFKASIPIIIGFEISMAMTIIDVIMLKGFDINVIGGLGLASTGVFIFTALVMGIGTVLQTSISHSIASSKKDTSELLAASLYWVFGLTVLIIIAGLVMLPSISQVMTNNASVRLHLMDFLRIWLLVGLIPYALSQVLRYYYFGQRRNSIVMVIIIISITSNIFFNWLLLSGYGGDTYIGIKGIALAKAISRYIELILFLFILVKEEGIKWLLSFNIKVLFDQLKYSSFTSLKLISEAIFIALCYILIDRLGETSLAMHHIVMRIWITICTLLLGVAICSQSFISKELAKGLFEKAREWKSSSFRIMMILAIVVLSFLNLFNQEIINLFTTDLRLIQRSPRIIFISSLSIIFLTYSISSSYYLIASKRNNIDFLISFIINWCIFLPIAFWGITNSKTLEWFWSLIIIIEFVRSCSYFFINQKIKTHTKLNKISFLNIARESSK